VINSTFRRRDKHDCMVVRIATQIDSSSGISLSFAKPNHAGVEGCLMLYISCF